MTSRRRAEMGQEVVVLDPCRVCGLPPGRFNPFDAFPLLNISLENFALGVPECLHPGQTGSLSDVFWDNSSDGKIAGISAAVLSVCPPERRHLIEVRNMLMSDDVIYNLAVLIDTNGGKLPALARQQIASLLQTEEKCRSGILATAQQHMATLYGPGVEEALTATNFDLEAFKAGKPITIFMVIPPAQLPSYGKLLRIWISTLLGLTLARTVRPEQPTLFLLDEAAQLGTLSSLRTAITLLRGYGVRTWTFWQDLAQLKRLYPDWESIVNNSAVLQMFGQSNHMAAKAAVELLGERTTAADLLRLPSDQQLVLRSGGDLLRLRKLDYLRDRMFSGLTDQNPIYASESSVHANRTAGRKT